MKKKFCFAALLATILLVGCGAETPGTADAAIEADKTVVEPTDEQTEDWSDKITYGVTDAKNVCLMDFTNNSDAAVEIEVNFVFDNGGEKADAGYGHLYCLGAGESGVICMKKPTDDTEFPIDGVTSEYTVSVSESGLFNNSGSFVKDISFEDSSDSDGNVTVTVTNTSDTDLSSVLTSIVYYSGEEPVWYDDFGDELTAGGSYSWTFDSPRYYDTNTTPIEYDSYKIIINHAYVSQY